MTDISLHIEYLLRYHTCVILPGIGAFLRTRRPAHFNEQTGVLEAPSELISFNSSIIADDGLLTHSVARKAGLTHEMAAVKVASAINLCRQALEEEGELTIGRIGILTMEEDGRLNFTPSRRRRNAMNSALHVSDFKQTEEIKESSREVSATDEKKYFHLRISRALVRNAAMFGAIVCLLSFCLSTPSSLNTEQVFNAAVVPSAAVSTTVEKTEKVDNELPVTTEEISTTDSTESLPAEVDENYYIIVATFSNTEDCEKFIAQQSDPSGLQIICGTKVCRVACAESTSREDLQEILRSDDIKGRYSQAWIWQSK